MVALKFITRESNKTARLNRIAEVGESRHKHINVVTNSLDLEDFREYQHKNLYWEAGT